MRHAPHGTRRYVVAAVFCFASLLQPLLALAEVNFVACRWTVGGSHVHATPEAAYHEHFTNTNDIVARCKPEQNLLCTASYPLPVSYACHANYSDPLHCNASGYSMPAYAWGDLPQTTDSGGKWHCYVDTWSRKNNCPHCGYKGNPVNVATGNKNQVETDLAPLAAGLEFRRHYNSASIDSNGAGMGWRWTHSWTRKLLQITSTEIQALRPDGGSYRFVLTGGVWVGDADNPEKLDAVSGGWTLTLRDSQIEAYDSTGRITTLTDSVGRVTTFTFSDGTSSGSAGSVIDGTTTALWPGMLIRVTDSRGRALGLTYDTNGNLKQLTDPQGGNFRYGYDSAENLTSVLSPDSATRTYVYNESANTSGANLPHAFTGIVDENSARFATFKYQTDERTASSEHAGGTYKYSFTYGSSSTTYTDPLGTSRTANRSTILGFAQITSTTQSCTGCGAAATESYTFDANRNITSFKDFNGNLTCRSWDTTHNLETARTEGLSGSGTCASRVTTSATRTITTEWHSTWRLAKRIAGPLKITTYSFNGDSGVSCAPSGAATTLVCSKTVQATTDSDGSSGFSATSDGAARTTNWTYNLDGQVLTVDGPRGDVTDVTSITYYSADDAGGKYRMGDRATVTNALGHVTQFAEYDAAGRLLKIIDPNGLETILEYFSRGWLKTRKVGSSAAGYEVTSLEYDSVGQLKKVTLPDASFVQYTYDDAHRLTDLQDGLGNRIHYTLDNMGNRTLEESYDPSNTLVRAHSRVIDGLNRLLKDIGGTTPSTQITQNGFDSNGNVTSVLDPLGRSTVQDFDALDRLTGVKDPFNGTSNPTLYSYNGQGQLKQVTDPTGLSTTYTVNGHGETTGQSSPDTGSTVFAFDEASNMKSKLDARGVSAAFSYDALNRLTQIAYPDETVTYAWDSCTNGLGRLCSISDASGTTMYSFDLWGRVTGKTQTVASLAQAMAYGFNSAGQLATVTTPSGRVVSYGYSNNRPVSIAVDGVSVLSSVVYEPFGPNGGWVWGNSAPGAVNTHTRVFDKDYRTTRVTSDRPATGTQPYFDKQVGWDIQSRVTSITDLGNSALNSAYGFDALDRITSATQGATSWGYTFNGIGDRLTSSVSGASTTYGYQSGTHRLTSLSGTQSGTFTVDSAGNMTSDGVSNWAFGGNNRPTNIGSTTVLINALGRRVKKATGSSVTRFVYDEAGHLWGEYDAAGALIQETVWLGDLPVATLRPNGAGGADIFYVHSDHIGTPRAITRASDNLLVWKWDNGEPFGNSAPDENSSGLGGFGFNLRFPGQYFDSETGTHYNYFRDYDPVTGRYVQSDPLGMRAGLNTYLYVNAKPTMYSDFFGLEYKCQYVFGAYVDKTQNVKVKEDVGEWRRNCWASPKRSFGPPDPLDGPPRRGKLPGPPIDFDWEMECGEFHWVVIEPAQWKLITSKWQYQWLECTDTCTGRKDTIALPDSPANSLPKF